MDGPLPPQRTRNALRTLTVRLLEEFTDNLEDTELHALRFRTSYESGIKIQEAQYLFSLPERPKLRSLLANQNDKGSLQKTHWRSSTWNRKVW